MGTRMDDIVARVTSQTQYSSLLAGDKFGFLSAKQYGAEGDGVTDDSAAILSMLTAASASTHKALYFPTGSYLVDGVTLTAAHFSGYYLFGDNANFSGITQHVEQIGNTVGNLSDLVTSATSSIVGAVNEVKNESVASVLTTRGDIIVQDSTDPIRLPTGTPLQYVVASSVADDTPLSYLDSPQKVMTTIGDMIYASGINTIAKVPASTGAGVLSYSVSSSKPTWTSSTGAGVLSFQVSSSAPNWINGTKLQYPLIDATTDNIEFYNSPQAVMTSIGDILYASAGSTVASLSIGTDNQALLSNGTIPTWSNPISTIYTASDDVVLTANTERTTSSATYVLLKSFKIQQSGIVRVKFYSKYGANGSGYRGYTLVTSTLYDGGAGIITPADSYTESTLDTSVVAGDTLNLYCKVTDVSILCYIKDCTICYAESISSDSSVLQD